MGKAIFDDDYFSKHRDTSQWENLKNKSLSNVLNLRNKPKKKLDEQIPPKKEEKKEEEEEVSRVQENGILDEEYKEQVRSTSIWKISFLQSVITGYCGGIVVLLAFKISQMEQSLWTATGLTHVAGLLLIALVFLIILGGIYRYVERGR